MKTATLLSQLCRPVGRSSQGQADLLFSDRQNYRLEPNPWYYRNRLHQRKQGNRSPSYDSLVLFKTELLRTWYGLSDGEVEEQVNDRLAVSITSIYGLEHASKHNYVGSAN